MPGSRTWSPAGGSSRRRRRAPRRGRGLRRERRSHSNPRSHMPHLRRGRSAIARRSASRNVVGGGIRPPGEQLHAPDVVHRDRLGEAVAAGRRRGQRLVEQRAPPARVCRIASDTRPSATMREGLAPAMASRPERRDAPGQLARPRRDVAVGSADPRQARCRLRHRDAEGVPSDSANRRCTSSKRADRIGAACVSHISRPRRVEDRATARAWTEAPGARSRSSRPSRRAASANHPRSHQYRNRAQTRVRAPSRRRRTATRCRTAARRLSRSSAEPPRRRPADRARSDRARSRRSSPA